MVDARAGATAHKLTEFFAPNKPALRWTPDGTRLIYTTGLEPRLNAYIQDRLSVFTLAEGQVEAAHRASRPRAHAHPGPRTMQPSTAIVEDDGVELPVSVRLDTGEVRASA